MRSRWPSSISPAARASPIGPRLYHCPGPGISRLSPARADGAVDRTANQSETTNPSNPHSSRNTWVSSHSFSEQKVPLSRL